MMIRKHTPTNQMKAIKAKGNEVVGSRVKIQYMPNNSPSDTETGGTATNDPQDNLN